MSTKWRKNKSCASGQGKTDPKREKKAAENVVPQKWQISRIYLNTSKQHMLANGHPRRSLSS